MNKQGFTLIELMMVLAVIGILAVIAIPYYQSYTIRARVTEGLGLAASAQLSVVDAKTSNGSLPANQAETNYVSPSGTENVSSIVIGANGVITITFTAKAGGGTILLAPAVGANGDISWDCTGGTLASSYRPGACR